jgi:hypothetical protein
VKIDHFFLDPLGIARVEIVGVGDGVDLAAQERYVTFGYRGDVFASFGD